MHGLLSQTAWIEIPDPSLCNYANKKVIQAL